MINITIAFIGEYCYMKDLVYTNQGSLVGGYNLHRFSPAEIRKNFGNPWPPWEVGTYWTDITKLAAVELVNSSPNILPGVHVNVKRFSECGGYNPQFLEAGYPKMTGYASAVLGPDIIDNNPDVIGVSGLSYSSTGKGILEELSLHKIPSCGVTITSPRFSNKNKYPYFIRMSPTLGFGEHLHQLLNHWNVKNVALIYQRGDEMSLSYTEDIQKSFLNHDISIVQTLGVTPGYAMSTLLSICNTILRSNVRYIVVSTQWLFLQTLYPDFASCGLISSQYVWISYNVLKPKNVTRAYLNQGFIAFLNPPPVAAKNFSIFQNEYPQIQNLSLNGVRVIEIIRGINYFQVFDCVLTLLLGFDKLLKSNPEFTPEMLASKKLQHLLNWSHFQDIDHIGLTMEQMRLNQYGDLALPYTTAYTLADSHGSLVGFGETNNAGTAFMPLSQQPVFFGNNTSVPVDPLMDKIPEFIVTPASVVGKSIFTILAVGASLCSMSMSLVTIYGRRKVMVRTSITYIWCTIAGCWLLNLSLMLYFGQTTLLKCKIKVWLQLLGYCTIISALASKLLLMRKLLLSGRRVPRGFSSSRFILARVGILVGMEIIFLVLWTLASHFTLVKPLMLYNGYITVCYTGANNPFEILVWIYNIALLLATTALVLAMSGIESYTGESAFAAAIISTLCVIGIVVVPVLISTTEPSSATIMIQADSVGIINCVVLCSMMIPKAISIFREERKFKSLLRLPSGLSSGKERPSIQQLFSNQLPLKRNHTICGAVGRPEVVIQNLGLACCSIQRDTRLIQDPWINVYVILMKINGKAWIQVHDGCEVSVAHTIDKETACEISSTLDRYLACISPCENNTRGITCISLEFGRSEDAQRLSSLFSDFLQNHNK
ncbi:periplasmic binding protein-like I [Obelidium mucronatum]|nr:periplasmic binding protein-like I [Obelidium mucronatum]